MKLLFKFVAPYFIFLIISMTGFAQSASDAHSLIKEGQELSRQKSYDAAIEKYKAALALEPQNASANYNMGFALYKLGKNKEAIPCLEKAAQTAESVPLKAGIYKLLGAVYDQDNQPQKAIENYTMGLKIDPDAGTMQNISLVYFRNKQYAEAEKSAIAAITLDKNAVNSYRTYALVTFHQNKRAAALLGFCSFLMLEPNTARSAEALGNMQHILQGGALKPEPGEITPAHISADDNALNQAITQAVAAEAKRKYLVATDRLTEQLRAIFTSVGQLAEKQTGNDFFRGQMAAYFYKLAQSPNMPAFARLISQTKPESTKWIKDNPQQMADLDKWIKETARGY